MIDMHDNNEEWWSYEMGVELHGLETRLMTMAPVDG